MSNKSVILVTVMVILGAVASAIAQEPPPSVYIDVSEVEGLTPNGYIPQGLANLTFPFRFANIDGARSSISNAFTFKGDGFANFEWNPAYPWNWSYAEELEVPVPFFGETLLAWGIPYGKQIIGEAGPDGTGLPADFDNIAFYIRLYDVAGEPGTTVTIDTAAGYPWLWSGAEGNLHWGGPYVFTLADDSEPLVPYTYCWPQPTGFPGLVRTQPEWRRLFFVIRGDDPDGMVIESIRLFDKWGPLEKDILVDGDSVVFSCDVVTFLGIAGLRPVTDGIETRYTLEYDMKTGEHRTLTGKYSLRMYWQAEDGDFDGTVDAAAASPRVWSGAEENLPQGGTYGFAVAEDSEPQMPYTYCWPQPVLFFDFVRVEPAERRLHFVIKGEQPEKIILKSLRLNGRFPPDAKDITIDGDSVVFSCDFMKFAGTAGFCPITSDFEARYTLEYDKTTGEHVALSGPFQLVVYPQTEEADLAAETPILYCWPQPTILMFARHKPDDPSGRILNFVVQGEQVDKVILESIRIQGKIIPDEVRVDGDSIVFACRVLRFMGASDLMPFVGDARTEYIVEYDKVEGKRIVLTDLYEVYCWPLGRDLELTGDGDLNLDGAVDLADVQFMAEYFFNGGPKCEDEARMDVDGNGQVDLQDLRNLISIVGM